MDTNAELAQLRNEVAQLRQQLAELKRFLHIDESEERPGHKTLLITCAGISLQNPDTPGKTQGGIFAGNDGPSVALWGSDERARLILSVNQDRGHLGIYTPGEQELKLAVTLGLDSSDHAQVGVCHEGRPRAVLKATPDMGAISAVHDDGLVRAAVTSHFDHGEMMMIGGDMKPAVRLSADGHDGGGYLTVNHPNGRAAIILSSTDHGGAMLCQTNLGETLAAWPDDGKDGDET